MAVSEDDVEFVLEFVCLMIWALIKFVIWLSMGLIFILMWLMMLVWKMLEKLFDNNSQNNYNSLIGVSNSTTSQLNYPLQHSRNYVYNFMHQSTDASVYHDYVQHYAGK